MGLDNQQFDRLARMLGKRQSRRSAMALVGAAAAAAAIPGTNALAGGCMLTCPLYSYIGTDPDSCTALVTLDTATSSGCSEPMISCTQEGSGTFGIGSTQITCTDAASDATCSYLVTVYDNNPDYVTCPEDITMTVDGPTSVTFDSPVWGTDCQVWLDTWICDHNSGDVYPIGTTTVTCTPDFQPSGKGPDNCVFNITLNQTVPTATATATEPPQAGPTSVPTEVPATEVPTAVDPTSIPADPTATTAPVTQLPNTGAGSDGSGAASKLIPVAAVGAGAALLARLGLRKSTADTAE